MSLGVQCAWISWGPCQLVNMNFTTKFQSCKASICSSIVGCPEGFVAGFVAMFLYLCLYVCLYVFICSHVRYSFYIFRYTISLQIYWSNWKWRQTPTKCSTDFTPFSLTIPPCFTNIHMNLLLQIILKLNYRYLAEFI